MIASVKHQVIFFHFIGSFFINFSRWKFVYLSPGSAAIVVVGWWLVWRVGEGGGAGVERISVCYLHRTREREDDKSFKGNQVWMLASQAGISSAHTHTHIPLVEKGAKGCYLSPTPFPSRSKPRKFNTCIGCAGERERLPLLLF